jgi:hypothetical protein
MNSLVDNLWTAPEVVAAFFAIIGGIWGTFELVRRKIRSRPFTKPLSIFSDQNSLRDDLLKVQNRTVDFDTVLDFSVWNDFSNRIVAETEYGKILDRPASELNNRSLPLYTLREGGHLESFERLVISVKNSDRLKYSHGGTGIIQVLFKGTFAVEVRHYSGPSLELTLREIT